MSTAPLQYGFEYEVRLAVSIPLAWAELLKQCAKHHYDYKCRETGDRGVVNGLYNTAQGGPLESTYAVSWRDLDLVSKVAELELLQNPEEGQLGAIADAPDVEGRDEAIDDARGDDR